MRKSALRLTQKKVSKLSTDGRGVVRAENQTGNPHPVIFVENALPDEVIDVEIAAQRSSYWEGKVSKTHAASPTRTQPRCPVASRCGGCSLQHIDASTQTAFKRSWLLETLHRVGRWPADALAEAENHLEVIAGLPWEYRQRVRLHCFGRSVGFHAKGSHDIVDIPSGEHCCWIAHPVIRRNWDVIRKTLQSTGPFNTPAELEVSVDATTQKLHFTFFVAGTKRGEAGRNDHTLAELRRLPCAAPDEFIQVEHPFLASFAVSRQSFVQPHRDATTQYALFLAKSIRSFVSDKFPELQQRASTDDTPMIAWDLYAGSGPFSPIPSTILTEFNLKSRTHAVEGHADSCAALQKNTNARLAQIHKMDVERFVSQSIRQKAAVDIVLTDPPRDGMGTELTAALASHVLAYPGPKLLLMVSCSPAAFARDAHQLLQQGFVLKSLGLFDMFGQTHHYEVIGSFVGGQRI